MNRLLSYLKSRTGVPNTGAGTGGDRRSPESYECPACGALIMSPSSDECSQCQSATLVPREG